MTIKTLICLMLATLTAHNTWAAQGHRCLIEPDRVAEIGSQVTGVVASIHAERGDLVRKGQLLARLHAGAERASVTVARTRAKADAELKAAKANYKFQRQKLIRAEGLVAKNFISQQALEQVRAETSVAEQKFVQAREQHQTARDELELAQAQLRMRTIRAPFAGIVAERYVAVGERVEERPMFRIARVDPLRVEIIVPAALFGTIESGMMARVTPDLPSAKILEANVVLVDKLIDPASNTFRVRAELANANSAIPSGLRCRAELQPLGKQVHAAPTSTIAQKHSGAIRPANLELTTELSIPVKRNSAQIDSH